MNSIKVFSIISLLIFAIGNFGCSGNMFETISADKGTIILPNPLNAITTSQANGSYASGVTIPIELTFDEPVSLADPATITVTLNTGDILTIPASDVNPTTSVTVDYLIGADDD